MVGLDPIDDIGSSCRIPKICQIVAIFQINCNDLVSSAGHKVVTVDLKDGDYLADQL